MLNHPMMIRKESLLDKLWNRFTMQHTNHPIATVLPLPTNASDNRKLMETTRLHQFLCSSEGCVWITDHHIVAVGSILKTAGTYSSNQYHVNLNTQSTSTC
jgi:hypothetical protein